MTDLNRARAARELQRLAGELANPQRAELVQRKLAEAGNCMRQLRLAAFGRKDLDNAAISADVQDEARMQSTAEVLQQVFEGYGFALLVFEIGEGGRMNYCSNCLRDDIVVAMREFIATHEGRTFPEPPAEPQ